MSNETEVQSADRAQPEEQKTLEQQLRDQLAAAQVANIELKSKLEQQEQAHAIERAGLQARQPQPKHITRGNEESIRFRAIEACGGRARWYQLSPADRLTAQGIRPCESAEELSRANRIFGGGKGASLEATQLMKASPAQYQRLRAIYREHNGF